MGIPFPEEYGGGLERLGHAPAHVQRMQGAAGGPAWTTRPGLQAVPHILDIGRIGVAAMGVRLAQGAFGEALAYVKDRSPRPIASP